MMLYLSRRTVRHGWPLYAGAFVALATGVLLLGLAGTTIAATVAYTDRQPPDLMVTLDGGGQVPYRSDDVGGLMAVMGTVATISAFITIFVVASTFAFVVAARRRELGLLRLVGATPKQVRRMVRGEAFVVALLASLTGAAGALLLTPVVLDKASGTELAPVELDPANPWLPLGIAIVAGVFTAMAGARSAARRAAKVAPVEALREAAIERRRIGWLRAFTGVVLLAGAIAMLALIRPASGDAVVPLGMFAPQLLVLAVVALAPLVLPPMVRLWSAPMAGRLSGRLARSNILAAPRRTASLAAPILAISAIAGSMVATLSVAADASAGHLRNDVTAPIVVTGKGEDLGPRLAATGSTVSGPLPVTLLRTDDTSVSPEGAIGIDPASFARTHRLEVRAGSLDQLRGDTVAISREQVSFYGTRLGDTVRLTFPDGTPAKLRVVAVLDNSFDVIPGFLLPMPLAKAHADGAVPPEWFVQPAAGADLEAAVGDAGVVQPVDAWLGERDAALRADNRIGLLLLIGPACLYAAIAIANTLLMGSLSRRHEFITARLLGATPAQVRGMVLCEATLVGLVALSVGAAITTAVGLLLRSAMIDGVPDAPVTIPWGMFGGIGLACLLVAVGSALAPTAYVLRNARPADAVGD